MRPTKLTHKLLDAFRAVLSDELASIAFTEEELVWQANQHLPLPEQITYRTYQRYKADILCEEKGDEKEPKDEIANEDEQQVENENTELVRQMHITLTGALMKQKLALVKGIYAALPHWRRYNWILERKFPDFRLRPLNEALAKPQQPKESPEEKKEREKAAKAEEAAKKKEYYIAKAKAEKDAELERLKDPAYKWKYRNPPWKPTIKSGYYTIYPDQLKALEAEMDRDVAAGYQNPYAHLGYRPDPVEQTDGHYLIMGMGLDRLPLRAHVMRTADAPNDEEREELWLKQEHQRLNIIRAEQGLPPENLPEPPEPPEEHIRHGRGVIYGSSAMR